MNFWKQEAEQTEGLSEQSLNKVENQLGVKLPEAYIELLKIQNGGYIEHNAFLTDFPTSWADDHINVEELRGIGSDSCILDSTYLIEEWDLPKGIVIIAGDGHAWIALDYREINENPAVILVDEDVAGIRELAPNFKSFIDGLTTMMEEVEAGMSFYDETETRRIIAEKTRNGRTNEEIIFDMNDTISKGTDKQVEKLLGDITALSDVTLEKYFIEKIMDYDSVKVRSALGGYLLACAMGMNELLDKQDVKEILVAMNQVEKNKNVRFFIEAGLEHLR